MASESVTPSVEQRCTIKFLVKAKMEPAVILVRLYSQSVDRDLVTCKCVIGERIFRERLLVKMLTFDQKEQRVCADHLNRIKLDGNSLQNN